MFLAFRKVRRISWKKNKVRVIMNENSIKTRMDNWKILFASESLFGRTIAISYFNDDTTLKTMMMEIIN